MVVTPPPVLNGQFVNINVLPGGTSGKTKQLTTKNARIGASVKNARNGRVKSVKIESRMDKGDVEDDDIDAFIEDALNGFASEEDSLDQLFIGNF